MWNDPVVYTTEPSVSHQNQKMSSKKAFFSIEPGIYLNDNCGVRIEDLFTIQAGNLHQLTQSPKELIEVSPN
jgi:Xaa-Pro aminopeptidase